MIKVRRNYSIAKLSTFRIGGRAKYFCEVKNFQEFLSAVSVAEKLRIPYKIVAGGSNVVFPDSQLNCLLVKIKQLTSPKLTAVGGKIKADAGVALADLIKKSVFVGLRGLETLSGIPGTVGGAIIGNAGAYGHSISEAVERVEVFDGQKRFWLKNSECDFRYRHSALKEKPLILLRAVLKFHKGNPKELKKISENIIAVRRKKYKPGLRCPGSFFKNVLASEVSKKSLALIDKNKIVEGKIPAGYLLEQVGAKGLRVGGIRIADFHGNLFINAGNASAGDVKKIAGILKNRVQKKFQIDLEEEIRYF